MKFKFLLSIVSLDLLAKINSTYLDKSEVRHGLDCAVMFGFVSVEARMIWMAEAVV